MQGRGWYNIHVRENKNNFPQVFSVLCILFSTTYMRHAYMLFHERSLNIYMYRNFYILYTRVAEYIYMYNAMNSETFGADVRVVSCMLL